MSLSSVTTLKNPAQLKARVAEIRERLPSLTVSFEEDSLKQSITNLVQSYKYLLLTEFLLRGVSLSQQIIEPQSSVQKLLEIFCNVVGKPLLSDISTFPNPLVAATCALNGIVADQCASITQSILSKLQNSTNDVVTNLIKSIDRFISVPSYDSNTSDAASLLLMSFNEVEECSTTDSSLFLSVQGQFIATINRCRSVNDSRLLALLQISSTFHQNMKYLMVQQQQHQSAFLLIRTFEKLSICFLAVARGHYLLGASSFAAEDQPQLWRKALDVIASIRQQQATSTALNDRQLSSYNISRKYHTVDAILPLSNLARISHTKGNKMKAIEWSIHLAEAHLGEDIMKSFQMPLLLAETSANLSHNLLHYIVTFFTPPPNANNIKSFHYCNIFIASAKSSEASSYTDNPLRFTLDLKQRASAGLQALHHYYDECTIFKELNDVPKDDKQQRAESNDLILRYHMISYCLLEAYYEYGEIQVIAHELFRRGTGDFSLLSHPEKKHAFEKKAWQQFLLPAPLNDNNNPTNAKPDQAANQLLDIVLKQCSSISSPITGTNSFMLLEESLVLLDHNVGRLTHRAQIMSLYGNNNLLEQKSWRAVFTFSLLLLQHLSMLHGYWSASNVVDELSILPLFNMNTSVCKAILIASWINTNVIASTHGDSTVQENLLPSVTKNDLALLISNLQHSLSRFSQQQNDKTGRGKENTQNKVLLSDAADKKRSLEVAAINSLEVALAGANCRQLLLGREGEQEGGAQAVGDIAHDYLKLFNVSLISEHANYGTAFLHCVISWSGLVQRPWQFYSVTQARTMISITKSAFTESLKLWGRRISKLETVFVKLAEADAEALLPGGLLVRAKELYEMALSESINIGKDADVSSSDETLDDDITRYILKAHSLRGLAQLQLRTNVEGSFAAAEANARGALESILLATKILEQRRQPMFTSTPDVFQSIVSKAIPYHLCLTRHCIAECLIMSDRLVDAQKFLEDSYRDFPNNSDAAFALGAFHLQRIQQTGKSQSNIDPPEKQAVNSILLKAAKLGSVNADPFALLGWWYELLGDRKRSLGCYSKALLLKPTHPVAGRGMVRLCIFPDVKVACKKAADSTSSENGWAWWALGRATSLEMGRDEVAATFFQQALRCRDIEKPDCDRLHAFFVDPIQRRDESRIELSLVWIDLASCYNRQGKFNAATSAYRHASNVSLGHLPPCALCSWAQVELQLGLMDEANERFKEILETDSNNPIAAYGHATCLLERAKSCASQGKIVLALKKLKEAGRALQFVLFSDNIFFAQDSEQLDSQHYLCTLKLWGDLHSFGFFLPSDVFADVTSPSGIHTFDGKLDFVSKAEDAYRCVLKSTSFLAREPTFLAAAHFDVGANVLSQAWIVAASLGEGSGGNSSTSFFASSQHEKVKHLLSRAVESFVLATDCNPLVSPAWCGLGCALIATEPLKAQHCFCQALHIDMKDKNSYGNIGMLCINFLSLDAAGEAFDCLTQIADTPIMWIGRGLAHEVLASKESSFSEQDIHFMNAADAYRAALQVNQNPAALLGLSLTSRRTGMGNSSFLGQGKSYISALERRTLEESFSSLCMFLSATGETNAGAVLLGGLLHAEESLRKRENSGAQELLEKGAELVNIVERSVSLLMEAKAKEGDDLNSSPLNAASGGLSLMNLFDASVAALTAASKFHSSSKTRGFQPSSEIFSLAKIRDKVHSYPDDGIFWLSFGKHLIMKAARMKKTNESTELLSIMESARSALSKSLSLLHEQVTGAQLLLPKRHASDADANEEIFGTNNSSAISLKAVIPSCVDAKIYAACVALHAGCVDNLFVFEEKVMDVREYKKRTVLEMQKALLIDPENPIARRGLSLFLK